MHSLEIDKLLFQQEKIQPPPPPPYEFWPVSSRMSSLQFVLKEGCNFSIFLVAFSQFSGTVEPIEDTANEYLTTYAEDYDKYR